MSSLPRPIFVVGSPRSGTSILTVALGCHPNLLATEESSWMGRLSHALQGAFALGSSRGERSMLSGLGVDRERFFTEFGVAMDRLVLLQDAPGAQDGTGAFAAGGAARLKARWVDGTPEYSHYIAGLARLFPEGRFVHVVRDVESVVASMVNFASVSGSDLVTDSAGAYAYWLRCVEACLQAEEALGGARVMRVLHRDLVRDPPFWLRTCLEFVGEEYHPDCAAAYETRINASVLERPADEPSTAADVELAERAAALSRRLHARPAPFPGDASLRATWEHAFDRRARFLDGLDAEAERALEQLARAERELGTWRRPTAAERIRTVVRDRTPYDALVVLLDAGDASLGCLHGRAAARVAVGRVPSDPAEAAAASEAIRRRVEALAADGADFLLVPTEAFAWLDGPARLFRWLEEVAVGVWRDEVCALYRLHIPPKPPRLG